MDHQAYIHELFDTVLHENGSDIHISAGRYPSVRVSGQLIFLMKARVPTKEDMMGILKVMLDEKKVERFMEDQEVDFAYTYQEKNRFRCNAYFQKGQIAIAIRLVPTVKSLQELRLPPILETFARKKQGFFLVVGPVGQGKSTTLAAMINMINNERAERIVTVEDPIEHIYEANRSIIDQREVGIDTKDFNTALKSIFREDINVILIGEMRSAETISTAVTAAETGHLVFSTLHTNNASQTIDRIVDSFASSGQQDQIRTQLASSLLGIFSQRLVPRISGGLVPAYELLINN
ncbi:PilT/PilU family type 4a pilus ATPase, partial [Candidatus Nomurabacteria bacterium]|nr:PilT/PilU family type 4a pilus ATPase [Candidatus Nomurabacteria bacterium]